MGVYTVFMLCRVVESRNPGYPVGSEWMFILCLCCVGWLRAGTLGTLQVVTGCLYCVYVV